MAQVMNANVDKKKADFKHLQIELFSRREVCELRRVVVDIFDQNVDDCCGVETWVSLVRHHHL